MRNRVNTTKWFKSLRFPHPSLLLICIVFGCASPRYDMVPVPGMEFRAYQPPKETPSSEMISFEEERVPVKKRQMPLVIIDPGHGGKDLGTHSLKPPKYQEKSLNLTTAMLVRHYLQKWGYSTILTRKDDVFISLEKRAGLANKMQSQLFVSVHYNSAPNAQAEGIEVFYFRSEDDKKRSHQSKKLAQTILSRVIEKTNARSRGVKHGNLAVIRETNMPAVLIEGGFLTNPKEQEKLRDKEYLKKIAWGIAKGIDDYLKKGILLAKEQS